jgi:hypothetical protein
MVPSSGTASNSSPWARTSDLDPGQHLLVADAAPRVGIRHVDQLPDRVLAVAGHAGGHALRDRGDLASDDQAAVVVAGDVGLDHDIARATLGERGGKRGTDLLLAPQVEVNATAVVAVEGLDHAREPESLRDGDGLVRRRDDVGARDRQPGAVE